MSYLRAVLIILASWGVWFALLMSDNKNNMNPDTKDFGFHFFGELLCAITGCRPLPIGTGAVLFVVVAATVFSKNAIVTLTVFAVVFAFLRLWKTLVVKVNKDLK